MPTEKRPNPAPGGKGHPKSRLRLDVLLADQGLFPSREAARRAVMAGLVSVNAELVDKPGTSVHSDSVLRVARPEHDFVSRGGLKLERALQQFSVDLSGQVVVDVGASTGGFTDCALRHGASRVYAVDVGYGQLDWRLRNDARVVVMERTNFRHVDVERFVPRPSVAVMDVSFISTRLLLPKLIELLTDRADIVSLIKPQFEAGRDKVGKGGIVRDPQVHLQVLHNLLLFLPSIGLQCLGLDYSPVTGGDGNLEYLGWWHKGNGVSSNQTTVRTNQGEMPACRDVARAVVREAWRNLRDRDIDLSDDE